MIAHEQICAASVAANDCCGHAFVEGSAVNTMDPTRLRPEMGQKDLSLAHSGALRNPMDIPKKSFLPGCIQPQTHLARVVPRSDGSKGGRPPFDLMFMFKVLILQASHSLSDERDPSS